MRIRFFLLFVLCVLIVTVRGQVPKQMNYQAVIRNTNGTPVTNQNISLKFTFYANASNGTVEYSESQSITTNSFGLVNLQIGTGTNLTGSWDAIDWQGAVQFLGVAVDLTGGSTYTELSNSKLSSVPYALQAERSSDNRWKLDGTDIINDNTGGVGIGVKPDGSAALEIAANGKGLLIPRMTQSELPTSPAEGLLVYQTDHTPGFYYYSGGQWISMKSNATSAGTIIPFASGQTPVTLSTLLGGLAGSGAAVGPGCNMSVNLTGGPIDFTQYTSNVAFVVPKNATITSISGFFTNTTDIPPAGGAISVTVQLYQTMYPQSNLFFPVPGTMLLLNPTLMDGALHGQTVAGTLNGLSVSVQQGARLLMIYTISSGLSAVQTVTGTISGGINMQ